MTDYSKYDSKKNLDSLRKSLANEKKSGKKFEDVEVPSGRYTGTIDYLGIKETKTNRLMFNAWIKIAEGQYKNMDIFFSRVISGYTSDKYTDAQAISSVCEWLEKLESSEEVKFESYEQFAQLVEDIYEEVCGAIYVDVQYKKGSFNSVKILGVTSC